MLLRRIIHINNICRLALLSFVTRVTFAYDYYERIWSNKLVRSTYIYVYMCDDDVRTYIRINMILLISFVRS